MSDVFGLRRLTHSYGVHPVLDIDSLDIPEGGVVGLIGPNGAGKSTLLKVLALLERRRSGQLLYKGMATDGREQEIRREVTLLLQEPYLLRRSVYENIAYGLRLRGGTRGEIDAIARDSLQRVGIDPDAFLGRPWFRLSGGEAQRISLATRLALNPRVLLLDEPTANVDEASAVRIKEAVWGAWNERGTTIVVATHDLVWLYEVATKVVSLYRGRAISDGAENFIQGDWRREDGCAVLALRHRRIRANLPDDVQKLECATLNPSDIRIDTVSPANEGAGMNLLSGSLTQLSIERATGEILGVVDCNGIFLRVRFVHAIAQTLNLHPGLTVYLSFPFTALEFI